ncbi:hypothetical protein ACXO2Y_08410, partial [Lactobacillus delbrueckii subsp. bulgaricus]
ASFVHGLIMEHMGEFESKRACSIKAYRTYGMTVKAKLYADDDRMTTLTAISISTTRPRSRLASVLDWKLIWTEWKPRWTR